MPASKPTKSLALSDHSSERNQNNSENDEPPNPRLYADRVGHECPPQASILLPHMQDKLVAALFVLRVIQVKRADS